MGSPSVHSVHFYDSDRELIERLAGVVCSSVCVGDAVLVVATESRRKQLICDLRRLDIDIRDYAREQRIVMCDAVEMLAHFMSNGWPDPRLFRAVVSETLDPLRKVMRSEGRGLTVFGEMVALLWKGGNTSGALALERLWNYELRKRVFRLHCACPRNLFSADGSGMLEVCQVHSRALGNSAVA
ncbi:MAG: hypothetical protein NVS9B15_00700 [Acidobacteriaceae bacterium]